MVNIFSEIEEEILFNDKLMFDESKIQEPLFEQINKKLNSISLEKRGFLFEEVVYDFFDYMNIKLIKTGKTRDFGIDGIIKINLDIFGEIDLGLQIKYSLIDSNDVDLFLASLKNAEIQIGVLVCKDSRNLEKYELNSKIKTILLSKGIKIKEKIIEKDININPVLIFKLKELIEVVTIQMRAVVRSIYKK